MRTYRFLTLVAVLAVAASCSEHARDPLSVDMPAAASEQVGAVSGFNTQQVADMLSEDPAAEVGVYLREIGGPVHAALNEHQKFEPASTIKALVHFHVLRWVQGLVEGGADLDAVLDGTTIQRMTGACPAGNESESLRFALSEMMGPSSNFWTEALRDEFGNAEINQTRQDLGMHDSQFDRVLGCGGVPGGDDADPNAPTNHLTLDNAGLMYEAVATGFLNPQVRAAGVPGSIMNTLQGGLNALVDEEAAALGLSAAAVSGIKAAHASAHKPGGVTLGGLRYSSIAGWTSLGFKDQTCAVVQREFVFGAFRHGADPDKISITIGAAAGEIFRDQIRAVAESWAACEADLEVAGVSVIDPPADLNVETPASITVRTAVRNNGPAPVVDGHLELAASAPTGCTVTPLDADEPVLGMAAGATVNVDKDFVVECSVPGAHTFGIDATITPLDPAVSDPVTENNTGSAAPTLAFFAHADLAVLDFELAALDDAGLGAVVVGQPFLFDAPVTLHNFGDTVEDLYTTPVDATVTVSLEIPAGVRGSIKDGNITVWTDGPTTISRDVAVPALEVGVDRVITETFGIHCLSPGTHDVAFAAEIAADNEHIIDPDPSNNTVTEHRTLDCVTPVQINIRPGNAQNFVNPGSNQAVPVAILTTEAGEYGLPIAFDATTIDHTSARFGTIETLNDGGGSSASPDRAFIRDSFEPDDKTKDGDLDMVLHFHVTGTGINAVTAEACVVGTYQGVGGTLLTFFGCDFVQPRP